VIIGVKRRKECGATVALDVRAERAVVAVVGKQERLRKKEVGRQYHGQPWHSVGRPWATKAFSKVGVQANLAAVISSIGLKQLFI
jgi:hypothetical protein